MTLTPQCTIQLFTAGAWRDVGSVSLFAPASQGWRAHSYTGYDVAWAVEHDGARDAHAFTCRFPVGLAAMELRVHAPLVLRERALFIPRFDRRVGVAGVERLAQESIASLTGTAGFGTVPSHDAVCHQLVRRCTDPQAEVLEYLRRDVANLALGNTDNHARNTALQRDFSGHVALSPLFDFAPMFLHPDGLGRRMRWVDNDAGRPDWSRVLDAVCQDSEPGPAGRHAALDRTLLRDGLRQMAPTLADLVREGEAMGLSAAVHVVLRPGIESLARQLDGLR